MNYIFYVFAARQAAGVFSYEFVTYSLRNGRDIPGRIETMTLLLTSVVTCVLEILFVCVVYALVRKEKNTVYAPNNILEQK